MRPTAPCISSTATIRSSSVSCGLRATYFCPSSTTFRRRSAPIEAMAAGLPVVVSDWDGYRFTVRDGIEGFLVPTLGGPPSPVGETIVTRHAARIDTYQAYVGSIAQHTAV